ncbi:MULTISPECIES: hypothetical protein [unclassified Leptolyngbya]|nr:MULTISPECIES: hypothetical protein [unclassified Leptolyngbya]
MERGAIRRSSGDRSNATFLKELRVAMDDVAHPNYSARTNDIQS